MESSNIETTQDTASQARTTKQHLALFVPMIAFLLVYIVYLLTQTYWTRYDQFITGLFTILDVAAPETVEGLTHLLEKVGAPSAITSEGCIVVDEYLLLSIWFDADDSGRLRSSSVVLVSDPLPREGPWFAQLAEHERRLGYSTIVACVLWSLSFVTTRPLWVCGLRVFSLIGMLEPAYYAFANGANIYFHLAP